jgi:16S rRNA (uracil1498-N3)-methyltransferase
VGDLVVAVDRDGVAHRVRLVTVDSSRAIGEALDRAGPFVRQARPERPVSLAVALARRTDEAIEKAVEAGVARIVTFVAARSPARTAGPAKVDRWRRKAESAAAQCGRADVPEVAAPVTFDEALEVAGAFGPVVLLDTDPAAPPLLQVIGGIAGPVSLVVGPEGDLSPEEVAAARAVGARPASLGPIILRVETACAVAVWAAAVVHVRSSS